MQEKRIPAAEPADWQRALDGVDFPAAKVAIVREAHDRGGLDREVLEMLERLPKDGYDTRDGLEADVRALYAEDGFDSTSLPL